MDPRLKKLIDAYLVAVADCVQQLCAAGAKLPARDYEWPANDFEPSGTLPDGRTYRCHGVGCAIKATKGRTVDFDFGENGEFNGFSISRLLTFVGSTPGKFDFASREEISESFHEAISSFRFSEYILYYLDEPSSSEQPIANARVTFIATTAGGRETIPTLNQMPYYRPHIVVQDSSIRQATYDDAGISNEHYMGVEFVAGPESADFEMPVRCKLRFTYYPRVDYTTACKGATFTVREGGRIVGYGTLDSVNY